MESYKNIHWEILHFSIDWSMSWTESSFQIRCRWSCKVSIQLENTIDIFAGISGSTGWIDMHCSGLSSIIKSRLWFMLALYCHCSRYYKRLHWIQRWHQAKKRWKSCWIDEGILWFGTDLCRCKTVSDKEKK